jgi:hypothetical protein
MGPSIVGGSSGAFISTAVAEIAAGASVLDGDLTVPHAHNIKTAKIAGNRVIHT